MAGAKLDRAVLSGTILSNVNLSAFCRAELDHRGSSIVDVRSIMNALARQRESEGARLGISAPSGHACSRGYQWLLDCHHAIDPRIRIPPSGHSEPSHSSPHGRSRPRDECGLEAPQSALQGDGAYEPHALVPRASTVTGGVLPPVPIAR